MKNLMNLLPGFFIILAFSCSDTTQECCTELEGGVELSGDWQVYERGYSPGAGYIVEEVPSDPAQTMRFGKGQAFSSTIEGLEDFTHYLILDDSQTGGKILALFKDEPGTGDREVDSLKHSYQISFEEGKLKLAYRFCIEGCHLGLEKL